MASLKREITLVNKKIFHAKKNGLTSVKIFSELSNETIKFLTVSEYRLSHDDNEGCMIITWM